MARTGAAGCLPSCGTRDLQEGLEELPVEFREALVLREIEGLSYKEIAGVSGVPVGTVMSRLARARERLKEALPRIIKKGVPK